VGEGERGFVTGKVLNPPHGAHNYSADSVRSRKKECGCAGACNGWPGVVDNGALTDIRQLFVLKSGEMS
jgi:hypothetical protein